LTIFALLLVVAACDRRSEDLPLLSNVARGCIENFDAVKDYFPKKVTLEFARNFSVEYHNSYKVVTVHQASQGSGAESYVLLQCGAPNPTLGGKLASAPIIPVPIVSLFSESTTHDQALIDLGRIDALTGIASAQYAVHNEVIDRIKSGQVSDFAANVMINAERVISAGPTILMAGRNDDPVFATIRNGGVPVVVNADWLDQTPLGRAEWIKYIALYLNEEEKAEERFVVIRDAYRSWKDRTAKVSKEGRPKVTTGGVFQGNYIVSGGRSYVAELIDDAGADYVWSDVEQTGSATIDIEAALTRAAEADYWINGGPWKDLSAMLADEPRYNEFKSFRAGQVWSYNRRDKPGGTNDYWARGIARPDLILADLIKIFHPELAADHEFQWYLQVPKKSK